MRTCQDEGLRNSETSYREHGDEFRSAFSSELGSRPAHTAETCAPVSALWLPSDLGREARHRFYSGALVSNELPAWSWGAVQNVILCGHDVESIGVPGRKRNIA